ncbi:MAG: hypothetical protein WD894_10870 [Pirellulales bacterium]
MNAAKPALILFERHGRWAPSLRRHGLVERLPLVEARSFAELEELLPSYPQVLVGLELHRDAADRVVAWLGRRSVALDAKVIVFAERGMRVYETVCREAGAVHFIASEFELFSLAAVIDRYLSQPAFAKLDEEKQTFAARIQARLPW